ncbi:helix-turn-helix domain-containing protein [Luteipulveratus mongoliensis]|uniref:helix-turn-helix domain-containing protein n=1 Tax=Luteipulveratus mongoliensis TaxID=571913 RepID=UPI000697CBF3|nr:helix-turn-helix domain-containing protein [Luteipulveratus mongoliensis]
MDFGRELRRLREERGLSLRALGARTHYSYGYLHDVEHGRKRATFELAARLDEALAAEGRLVACATSSSPIGELASGAPPVSDLQVIASVWEWEFLPENPDASRSRGRRIGAADVEMLRSARTRYENMYRQVGGVATIGRVSSFLDQHATPLLHGTFTDKTGRGLHQAAASLAAVAGICAFDAADHDLARRYLHDALGLARTGGDRGLGCYVIALLANQSFLLGDYPQSLAFAGAGLRATGPQISQALRADLSLTLAKAYARLGAATDSHQQMTAAERAASNIRPENEPPETSYIQPGLVELQLAEALTHLNDLKPARRFAEQAARMPAHPRGRVQRLATLARVELSEGDADSASALAHTMVDAATGMESHQLKKRFAELRDRLSRVDSPAVEGAVQRIEQFLAVPL